MSLPGGCVMAAAPTVQDRSGGNSWATHSLAMSETRTAKNDDRATVGLFVSHLGSLKIRQLVLRSRNLCGDLLRQLIGIHFESRP